MMALGSAISRPCLLEEQKYRVTLTRFPNVSADSIVLEENADPGLSDSKCPSEFRLADAAKFLRGDSTSEGAFARFAVWIDSFVDLLDGVLAQVPFQALPKILPDLGLLLVPRRTRRSDNKTLKLGDVRLESQLVVEIQ
ncbi:MAG: hypothetical protein IT177_11120 [Acidobacteria bacterium]|nr:hypothetical protein [Acidobacteriota bacterium]